MNTPAHPVRLSVTLRSRRGTTLVELLMFVAILAVVGFMVLPLLFSSTEDRLLQQTASLVEQNGVQLLQTIGNRIRHAERIVSPAPGFSGSVLVLQVGSGAGTPVIIGINSGSIVIIRKTARQVLSSTQVAVESFKVHNTSVSPTRPSAYVQFRLSRTIRLQAPRSYTRTFEALYTLLPDDDLMHSDCACAMPGCVDSNTFAWQVCQESECLTAQTPLQCP